MKYNISLLIFLNNNVLDRNGCFIGNTHRNQNCVSVNLRKPYERFQY